jgi:5-methylcytosine-specific restriction endonuclease McrA
MLVKAMLLRKDGMPDGRQFTGEKARKSAISRRFKNGLWLCTNCKQSKDASAFPIRNEIPDSNCRKCLGEMNKRNAALKRPALAAEAERRKIKRMEKRQAELLKCEKCGATKPRSEWPKENVSNKILTYCCSTRLRSQADVANDIATQTKECSGCKLRKPFSDFSPNKRMKDGRQKTCKPCRSAKVHSGEWNGNKRRQAIIDERSDGSITTELMNRMFSIEVCPCCDGWMERDDKVLDHIVPLKLGGGHTASNVMVLCWSCNSGKHAHHPSKWLHMLKPEAAERMRIYYNGIGLNFDT